MADLRNAIQRVALAQANIGIAVRVLIAGPGVLTSEEREELGAKVDKSVDNLVEVIELLLKTSDDD